MKIWLFFESKGIFPMLLKCKNNSNSFISLRYPFIPLFTLYFIFLLLIKKGDVNYFNAYSLGNTAELILFSAGYELIVVRLRNRNKFQGFVWILYPTPRTVIKKCGSAGSTSNFWRRWRMWTWMVYTRNARRSFSGVMMMIHRKIIIMI